MNNIAPTTAAQLAFTQLHALSPATASSWAQGLGLIWFGQKPDGWDQASSLLPTLAVPLTLITPTPSDKADNGAVGTGELWLGQAPGALQEFEGISYRCDEHTLFGVLHLKDSAAGLQDQARTAYDRMFRLLAKAGYSQVWRTWNFLEDIHAQEPILAAHTHTNTAADNPAERPTLERYRQFNVGRQAAYDTLAQSAPHAAPAACALGMREGGFCFAFLAGKTPPILLENPRQTSAYHYPATYGPRSPTFSRAALILQPSHALLLISGTASIVGHESRHMGNVRAQTRETLTNLSEIVAQANDRLPEGELFTLSKLHLRVYVRHPEDADAVRRELRVCLGKQLNLCFVQADVCRQELLVEIEASGLSTSR
jgi:enamine deaminase RidA (YjgF/YER057c/UK114 family)